MLTSDTGRTRTMNSLEPNIANSTSETAGPGRHIDDPMHCAAPPPANPTAQQLPTVLLRHQTAVATHHDWLMADPHLWQDPQSPLFTLRILPPSSAWARTGTWIAQCIVPHRRRYLMYEGPLSGGRGHVVRIDEGIFIPLTWSDSRIVIDLTLRYCQGRIQIRLVHSNCWRATFTPFTSKTKSI